MELFTGLLALMCTIVFSVIVLVLAVVAYVLLVILACLTLVLTPQVLGFIIVFLCVVGIVKLIKRIFR